MQAERYTEYADKVMDGIAGFLIDRGISTENDCSMGCVYFNDSKAKKTYRVVLEECEYYEGK